MHPKYEYVYELPERLLAHEAIEPRDAARLFVFNTKDGSITHDYFYNLDKYIPAESIFVLNKTRVVKARCEMYKQTGGKLECFFLTNEIKDYARLPVLVDRRLEVGSAIYTYDKRYSFNVESQNENIFYLKSDLSRDEFYKFLEMYGQTPLPKYIKSTEANSDKVYERYNTTFAETGTSVAAPTASLHFTQDVFDKLRMKGCAFESVCLDVGFGTFKTPTEEDIQSGRLHLEPVTIKTGTIQSIKHAKSADSQIVCVGTTVVRSLESLVLKGINCESGDGDIMFDTDIFIKPPYNFTYPDILITNFHLPGTSLMMLVQAFIEYKGSDVRLVDLYKEAITNNYRFYSFGDSMLIV